MFTEYAHWSKIFFSLHTHSFILLGLKLMYNIRRGPGFCSTMSIPAAPENDMIQWMNRLSAFGLCTQPWTVNLPACWFLSPLLSPAPNSAFYSQMFCFLQSLSLILPYVHTHIHTQNMFTDDTMKPLKKRTP